MTTMTTPDIAEALDRINVALSGAWGRQDIDLRDVRAVADELERLRAQVSTWESELSAVMPSDFKDWHENSRSEWPAVAAAVILALRADRDRGWDVAARAQVAPAGEPAAWLYESWFQDQGEGGDNRWERQASPYRPEESDWTRNIRPLYLSSPAAPAQQAETSAAAEPSLCTRCVVLCRGGTGCVAGCAMPSRTTIIDLVQDQLTSPRGQIRAAQQEPTHD